MTICGNRVQHWSRTRPTAAKRREAQHPKNMEGERDDATSARSKIQLLNSWRLCGCFFVAPCTKSADRLAAFNAVESWNAGSTTAKAAQCNRCENFWSFVQRLQNHMSRCCLKGPFNTTTTHPSDFMQVTLLNLISGPSSEPTQSQVWCHISCPKPLCCDHKHLWTRNAGTWGVA